MPFFVHSPASEKQICGNVVLTWKKREKATPAFISNFATKQKKITIPRSAFCLSTHFRFPSFAFFVFCVTEKFSVRTQSSLPQSSLHSPHTELCRRQLEATAAAAAHSPSESTPLFKKGSGMPRRGRKTWWASRGAADTVRTRTLKPIPTTLVLKSEAVPKKAAPTPTRFGFEFGASPVSDRHAAVNTKKSCCALMPLLQKHLSLKGSLPFLSLSCRINVFCRNESLDSFLSLSAVVSAAEASLARAQEERNVS